MPKAAPKARQKYTLHTYYVGDYIDLRRLQEGLKKYSYLNRDHPLVLEITKDAYVVLTKFGAVTLWNVREDLTRQFIKEIEPYVKGWREKISFTDTIDVHVGGRVEKTSFDEVVLQKLDLEKIKIISYVSAQSVALDRYEEDIDERLKDLGKVVEQLKTAGEMTFPQKSLLKQIGNVLSVKQRTVSSLSLFDKPEETWKREEMERLYLRLRDAYDLRNRFDILNEKIDFLSENNTTLINFITSQKANFLEFVILILVIIEVILFLLELFKVFPK